MSTNEDIDCIVQDIDPADAPLDSNEKPLGIDVIQKHVEESLLFLDEDKTTIEKSENELVAFDQKNNIVVEKPGSGGDLDHHIVKQDDDSVTHIEMEANEKNTGELLKNPTVITENKVDRLENEKIETSNIPEQTETHDVIMSFDNTISDSVLHVIDKNIAVNDPQDKASGISEQTDTVNVVVSQVDNSPNCWANKTALGDPQEVRRDVIEPIDNSKEIVSHEDNPPSDYVLHGIKTDAVANVSLEQKSIIPLLAHGKIGNIVSLDDVATPDTMMIEVANDAEINDREENVSDISQQTDISKSNVLQKDNSPSESDIHEMVTNSAVIVSLEQKCEIPQPNECKIAHIESLDENFTFDSEPNEISSSDAINNTSENTPSELLAQSDENLARNVFQQDNPLSHTILNETDIDATVNDSKLKSSDKSEQSNSSKVDDTSHDNNPSLDYTLQTDTTVEINNVQEKTSDNSIFLLGEISKSDSLLDNETDTDVSMNKDFQKGSDNNSKSMTNEISNVLQKQKSPSESMFTKNNSDENMDDTQEGISDISQQTDEGSNVSQEKNSTSEAVLANSGSYAAVNGPQEEISDVSELIDINDISKISQEVNNVLTDTDTTMNVSSEVPERIEIKNVDNIYQYKILNETDTDVSIHDSREVSDISELIDSKEVSIVSQENPPSARMLNKTDDSQEETDDMKIRDNEVHKIDDSNISENDNALLNTELDKTDADLHEVSDKKSIEKASCQDNLKPIEKEYHENNATEPQKSRNLVESKENNNPTDEPTQSIENIAASNEEKPCLPEIITQVETKINETEQMTQTSAEKVLVWEIKSIKHEPEQQQKELLQNEISQEQNVAENPTNKNLLVRAGSFSDDTDCPPLKRSRFQPVWTTNPLNDEDKQNGEQAPVDTYYISPEAKKELHKWIFKHGIGQPKAKYMYKLVNEAKRNRAALRMAPIPKDYKSMDVFRIIRDQTAAYDKDITKNIQFIHIHTLNDDFNAAFIKWREIDKLLVVKAYQILISICITIEGMAKQPVFKYDNRSVIDWDANDRPILKKKDGDMETSKAVSTPAPTPVVTPIATDASTSSATFTAKRAGTPLAIPSPRKPPPPAFVNGEINISERQTYGLTKEFMAYHQIRLPFTSSVFILNLDKSHSIDRYYRIFNAAGDILDFEILNDDQPESLKLRISYNHVLEAIQAVSMFHKQILYDRVIEVIMGNIHMDKKPPKIEGFGTIGSGLGLDGKAMKNIRSNIEVGRLRARMKMQLNKVQKEIHSLRQQLSAATSQMDQAKKDEERKKYKFVKKQTQSQNESQNQQASMDAVSVLTTAIASSVQANVMGMLGIQSSQQGQNSPSAPVNNQSSGIPQNQNISRAPVTWTANENTTTALPVQPMNNMLGQTSIENAFQNFGNEPTGGFQTLQDPHSYYANMQQPYAQYGYNIDPCFIKAYVQPGAYMQPGTANNLPGSANIQPGTTYMQPNTTNMQPGTTNMQPVPVIDVSNVPLPTPNTQHLPPISNHPVPSKPSNSTQSKVHTESKTVFPPLPTASKNITVYEIQKPPRRFDVPPDVDKKTAGRNIVEVPITNLKPSKVESKVPDQQQPIPSVLKPAVKVAFKVQKPIVLPKVTKPATINIKIPSMLPETVPLVIPNPRTQDVSSIQRKTTKIAGNMPEIQKPVEPLINKQIKDMRKNSKSPERIRKSSEKIKSPDRGQKTVPKVIIPSKTSRRTSRSPERRISRSPVRRNNRSPILLSSLRRSTERRRQSRSPKRRMSRSPIRRRSRSPIRRRSRSTERRRSRSPKRRSSRSPRRRSSRSPRRRSSRSPKRRSSRSPKRRYSRSPRRRSSRSPKRRSSRSPIRRSSRSPIRRSSRSPIRRSSRSPKRRSSKSPVRRISKSPVGRRSGAPSERKGTSKSRSPELGPKAIPRPVYGPDGASRDIMNLEHDDETANYNYILEMDRESENTSVNFSFLPPSVTTDDLTEKMSEIGELLEVKSFGMGRAMVVFKFRHDAETCIEMYNMAKVDGETIEVTWASIIDVAV